MCAFIPASANCSGARCPDAPERFPTARHGRPAQRTTEGAEVPVREHDIQSGQELRAGEVAVRDRLLDGLGDREVHAVECGDAVTRWQRCCDLLHLCDRLRHGIDSCYPHEDPSTDFTLGDARCCRAMTSITHLPC